MDVSTVNQIIESAAFIVITLLLLFVYLRGLKIKQNISNEVELLRDCLFYRAIIDEYRREKRNNNYNKYRERVAGELGYSHSRQSEPAEISKRLEVLKSKDEKIDKLLNKLDESL